MQAEINRDEIAIVGGEVRGDRREQVSPRREIEKAEENALDRRLRDPGFALIEMGEAECAAAAAPVAEA